MGDRIIETYFANGHYAQERRENTKNNTPLVRRADDEIPKETSDPYRVPVNKFRGTNLDITV